MMTTPAELFEERTAVDSIDSLLDSTASQYPLKKPLLSAFTCHPKLHQSKITDFFEKKGRI